MLDVFGVELSAHPVTPVYLQFLLNLCISTDLHYPKYFSALRGPLDQPYWCLGADWVELCLLNSCHLVSVRQVPKTFLPVSVRPVIGFLFPRYANVSVAGGYSLAEHRILGLLQGWLSGCIWRLREDGLVLKTWVQWEYHLSVSGTIDCPVNLLTNWQILAKTRRRNWSTLDLHYSKLIVFFWTGTARSHSGKNFEV